MIYHAVRQVAQKDVVTMEKGQSTENSTTNVLLQGMHAVTVKQN